MMKILTESSGLSVVKRNTVDSFEENGERRSENVEKFGELSAGFNAQRSVSTRSHDIITKVSPVPHL